MSLHKLNITHLRNIQNASLSPASGFNFIYGKNASGKSSLLEAIYLLGRARSFRTSHLKHIISHDQEAFIVSGKVINSNGVSHQIGLRFDGQEPVIRFNQSNLQSREQLAYTLPIQLIEPKTYKLLDSGPQIRREFIDWGVFNENKNFIASWRKFSTVLKQRNALLKAKKIELLKVWDKEFVNYGTIVSKHRSDYIERLEPFFISIVEKFISFSNLKLQIKTGWDLTHGLKKSLQMDLDKDIRYGYTTNGPHRSDLLVLVNNRPAKDYVSRGQLKLLVLGLKLAQIQLLKTEFSLPVCILIDDFTAELDLFNREKLLNFLATLNYQVFLTATELNEFGPLEKFENFKMFHVEHGQIK